MPLPEREPYPDGEVGPWHEVTSSTVGAVRDAQGGEHLDVFFPRSGTVYRYHGAGWRLRDMLEADSKGVFLNTELKPYYHAQEL